MREAPRHSPPPPLRLPVLRLPAGWRHLSEDELLQRAAQAYLAHRTGGDSLMGPEALMPPQRPEGLPERRQADRRGPSSWPEPEPRLRPLPQSPASDAAAMLEEGQGGASMHSGHASMVATAAATETAVDGSVLVQASPTGLKASLRRPAISGWFLAGAIFLAVVQVVLALVALVPKAFDPRPGQQQTGARAGVAPAPPAADPAMQPQPARSEASPALAPQNPILQVSPPVQAASQ